MKKSLQTIVVWKVIGLMLLSFFLPVGAASAATEIEKEAKVLVLYSSKHGNVDSDQRLLDMAIGAFSNDITFKHAAEVEAEDTEDITHLFYYGNKSETLPSNTVKQITSFSGTTVVIGKNIEQLDEKYDYVSLDECETITTLKMVGDETKKTNIQSQSVTGVITEEETDVLVAGEHKSKDIPVFVKQDNTYYSALDSLVPPYSVYFSQALHDVFDTDPSEKTPGYIRLEDIHPLADPDQLMEVAEFLKEKEIPYLMAVIPVYTHPETGEEYHFNDSPEVLKAVRYMQENGGSVVLHGYTHQFRDSETGEGFEFWDVEHEMPIYHGQDEEVVKKTERDFDSEEEYAAYVEENKAYEREYIEKRLTRGIEELTNFGLHPLAFEAPHYTMSQNGYDVVSNYFSTYVGQIQLSDKDWKTMETTPAASTPSFLNGMEVLPETIGYIRPEDSKAVDRMMKKANNYEVMDGGIVGGFYHPYLGVDGLKEIIGEMEKVPNIDWIDLKDYDNKVETDNVVITSGSGTIFTDIDRTGLMLSSIDFPIYHVKVFIQKMMWGVAGIGLLSVSFFIGYVITQRVRRKRLEGEVSGG
ncbi:uncharacterized protein YdaL [Salibacterium salarium]|uniref:DUF2334 domain-containing protein n=1 Tax=Salibacterium salarium TaxID=284579 RepID=UPI002781B7EA|nr:DUF2334 domain-containing protein [Salibacterium salarium]MDQ0298244.1 uncharacterized protein YdaL [Salibacterium salarium]